ncbi:MAG: hypothetical protein D6680_09440 [Cyanobacteria bacterium J007]|nr:MAG: hypothetical protein D6680_09440 [Cyanobacteria bacterium J007]
MQHWRSLYGALAGLLMSTSLIPPAFSQVSNAQGGPTCQATAEQIAEKDRLRQAALSSDETARQAYQAFLEAEGKRLDECRNKTWPQDQALWLRLYPCDAQPGQLDALLDRVVNKGYNKVFVEYFYDGQVLLPATDNPTPWPSVIRTPGYENVDLLAESIEKGRERGLEVYAWLFTLNFGYTYSQMEDRQGALARNGEGQTTLSINQDPALHDQVGASHANHAFIDPYSPQARRDYSWLIDEALERQPDGVLFDYVRYLRGTGPASVVSKPSDLWIYSQASQQTLLQRGMNQKGRELIRRFITQGYISVGDIEEVDKMYPNEVEPLWHGRTPPTTKTLAPPAQRQPLLQWELWYLSVAHAVQGVLDFVDAAAEPIKEQGLAAGTVFFPGGNRPVGDKGFDSRLQPWDRFPAWMEWHPMAYANCGDPSCIMDEIQRVVSMAPEGTQVIPALAGDWGQSVSNRPSLEAQMFALQRQFGSKINSVSHFAYSWQEPDSDRDRKFCQLPSPQ